MSRNRKAGKTDVAAKLAQAIDQYKSLANSGQLTPLKKKRLEERIATLSEKANRMIKSEGRSVDAHKKLYSFIDPTNGKIVLSRSHVGVNLIPCDGRALKKVSNHVLWKMIRHKHTVRFLPLFNVRGLRWLRVKPNPDYERGTFWVPNYNVKG